MIKKLNWKETLFFYFLILLFCGSLLSWGIIFYYSKTQAIPKFGGEYIEGIVGQPQHLNPIIASSNNTDRDLVRLVYSSLFKLDDNNKIKNDLAESYEISEDKLTYTIHLKENVFWHDQERLTAKDVLFTVNLINDANYKSPLRSSWSDVKTDIIDDQTVIFKISTPFVGFLNNLTFGIMPKHLWENVGPESFALNDLNLTPIGSGPYQYNSFQKNSQGNIFSYRLSANPNYYKQKPYISKITFNFYSSEDELLEAYNTKEIMGMGDFPVQKLSEIKKIQSTNLHRIGVSWYFAVFINQNKSVPLAYDEVRRAIAHATDRQEIINSVFGGNVQPAFSPFAPNSLGYTNEINKFDFNLETANKILDDNGWIKGEDGVRVKDGKRIEFNLVVLDQPELVQISEILKKQWEAIGSKVNIGAYSAFDIRQNYIRPREYDTLIFGQSLSSDLDPYTFWHSSMKKDPGLNLSIFDVPEIDKLIEEGRIEFNEEKRASIYREFQKKLAEEIPAIFLYHPTYFYPINKNVRGNDIYFLSAASDRFSSIENWYLKTKRIWKK